MDLPSLDSIWNVLLIVAAVAVGWTVLRFVLKLTARLFAIGCGLLLALVAIGWFIGWF
jgi:hypothetical protein